MTDNDKKTILKIIEKHVPKARVYLFGSRARHDHTAESDIDVAIDASAAIDRDALANIREELEESTIPFTIDVVDIHTAAPKLKEQILKDGKLWNP